MQPGQPGSLTGLLVVHWTGPGVGLITLENEMSSDGVKAFRMLSVFMYKHRITLGTSILGSIWRTGTGLQIFQMILLLKQFSCRSTVWISLVSKEELGPQIRCGWLSSATSTRVVQLSVLTKSYTHARVRINNDSHGIYGVWYSYNFLRILPKTSSVLIQNLILSFILTAFAQ